MRKFFSVFMLWLMYFGTAIAGVNATSPVISSTLGEGGTFDGAGAEMHWYRISMPDADHRVVEPKDQGFLHASSGTDPYANLFAFVGDASNGYVIYNYISGNQQIMWVEDGNNSSQVKMVDKATHATNQRWFIGQNQNGFYLRNEVSATAYPNRHGGGQNTLLKVWNNSSATSDANSRFVFTPVDHEMTEMPLPVVGKKYYLFNQHKKGAQCIYDNNGAIGYLSRFNDYQNYKDVVWVCEKGSVEGSLRFRNLASNRYFNWRALSANNPFDWDLSAVVGGTGQVSHYGNVTMRNKGISRFLVISTNGNGFKDDQADKAFDTDKSCSDFRFQLCTLGDNDFVDPTGEDFLSQKYNEKWVYLAFNRDGSYAAGIHGVVTDQVPGICEKKDYSAVDQLWCLVGNIQEGFKMFSKAAGETMALHVAPNANGRYDEALPALMVNVEQAGKWKFVKKGLGFAIVPSADATNALNAYGGAGNELKLYRATDDGGWWRPEVADLDRPLHFSIEVKGTPSYPLNTRVSEMKFLVNGMNLSSTVSSRQFDATYYIPNNRFSLSMSPYHGYSFDGFLSQEGQLVNNYESQVIPAGGMTVKAVFQADENNKYQYLFYSNDAKGKPYRIPAIATAMNGDIIAISDYRPGGADVGRGEVDIKYRISKDNGQSWGAEKMLADGHWGSGEAWQYSFGDAAVVADRESNKVLVMMVCGDKNCWAGDYDPNDASKAPNRVARTYGTYANGEWSFSPVEEVTNTIYPKFDKVDANGHKTGTVRSLFIGSGRICQSRVVKVKEYYRLYCALWTRDGGNRVIYSDDFGGSWNVLGSLDDRPASQGDEPKCEELPDGRVILSSRKGGGRYFNIFTFKEGSKTEGTWGQVISSNDGTGVQQGIAFGGNSTNGEIMMVKAMKNGVEKNLMLQSVPTGGGRSHVAIFYKEINNSEITDPVTFASNWTKGLQVSDKGSAYSTMSVLENGNIGFFFEENPAEYCMVYTELSIEEITGGVYTKVLTKAEQIAVAEAVLAKVGAGYPVVNHAARQTLKEAIEAYRTSENLVALQQALKTYEAVVTDIQMPEAGKAYQFSLLSQSDGSLQYLKYGVQGSSWSNNKVDATVYVCQQVAPNKYAFVNNEGKYLTWFGNRNGYNDNKGYADAYVADWCDLEIAKIQKGNHVVVEDNSRLFGCFSIKGRRGGGDNDRPYFVVKNNNVNDGARDPFFKDGFSSAILMEEVAYPNTPKLNPIVGDRVNIEGAKTIATFSAPFATVLPAEVSAFYIKADGINSTYASLTKVEGAVPANQGVILTGAIETMNQVVMLPATAEASAQLVGNQLAATAGAAKELTGEFYLLGKYGDNVGFFLGNPGVLAMNKAYLPVVGGQAPSIKLVWNEEATGIEGVEAEVNADAPIYDLSGRRVLNTVKGGIYIKNGKKFIVK